MANQTKDGKDIYGQTSRWPYVIPPRGWWHVFRRVWTESQRDNISVIAAGCAFFSIFALFPAMTALVSVYVLWSDPASVEQHLSIVQPFLPPQAYEILLEQIKRIVGGVGSTFEWGLIVSVAIALWSANRGTSTLITALNVAYEESERRSWLSLNARTLSFTLAGILGLAITMSALVYVPIMFAVVGLPDIVQTYVSVLRWPLLAAIIIGGLALLYKYGPCRRAPDWAWVSVGSVFAAVMWLAVSAGFSLYVENFANYGKVYGSLGAVIVLLFWLYLTFLAILLGAELNAELEHHTEHDTTIGKDRPLGKRGAQVADHVADI